MGFGKDNKGVIITEQRVQALGTLADVTALIIGTGLVLAEDFRIIKTELLAHVSGLTAGEGVGLHIGICNGELTVAEIKQALAANGPLNRNDAAPSEQAMRYVKKLAAAGFVTPSQNEVRMLNAQGGPMINETIRWTFSDPQGWNFYVFNDAGAALTTGATIRILVKHYGVWVT